MHRTSSQQPADVKEEVELTRTTIPMKTTKKHRENPVITICPISGIILFLLTIA